jgi:hypothetical protein
VSACSPANLLMSHNLQHQLQGTKEKRAKTRMCADLDMKVYNIT